MTKGTKLFKQLYMNPEIFRHHSCFYLKLTKPQQANMNLLGGKPVAVIRDPEPKFAAGSYHVTEGQESCYINMNHRTGLSAQL